jgi:pimeloyl-ACP methyl ester carboxylesterase
MSAAFPLIVEERGEGPPLVLIHGFAGDRHTWDGAFPALAKTHRVIRYDLRGFGASPAAVSAYEHTDDLMRLLDERGVETCDLVGVSWGGSQALHFALENPRRVKRLVLESPGLLGWDWSPEWRALWSEVETAAKQEGADAARDLWLSHPMFITLRAHPEAFDAFVKSTARYTCRHWLTEDPHEALARPDVEQLTELEAATLLITGAQDMGDYRLIAAAIETMAEHVTRVDVAGAGHLVHLEQPGRFLAEVERFLAG